MLPRRPHTAASLSIGDRNSPLEANPESDPDRNHPKVGTLVEVSPIAGGDLLSLRGQTGKITGVISRFGQIVGYEVEVAKSKRLGSLKDFFVDREVLEDVQPATATSAAVADALKHWDHSRTYWHTRIDGLENLCFELASVTPQASPRRVEGGFQFWLPEPLGDQTVLDLRVVGHGNFWTLGCLVFSKRPVSLKGLTPPPRIASHWDRVFQWAGKAAKYWGDSAGMPWADALKELEARKVATERILRPLVREKLRATIAAKRELFPNKDVPRGEVHAAFSSVRLKAGTIGLTEPPTDRRPYTVMSVSPATLKDRNYLDQVVLHECIHIVVASVGGPPHNPEFMALAEKLGLEEKYRD
jgi:hypothetical protein